MLAAVQLVDHITFSVVIGGEISFNDPSARNDRGGGFFFWFALLVSVRMRPSHCNPAACRDIAGCPNPIIHIAFGHAE